MRPSLGGPGSFGFRGRPLPATQSRKPEPDLRPRRRPLPCETGIIHRSGVQAGAITIPIDSASTEKGAPARAIAGLAALQDLDVLLDGADDPRSQRPICRQVMEARRKLLGPDHPTTIEVEARLAAIAMELEEYQGARDAYTVLIERCERVLGPRNLDTLSAVHGLAVALSFMDEPTLARPLYERVFNGRRNSLGIDDPTTLSALHNLALTQRALGDNLAARTLFEELLDNQRRVFGPEHALTLRTMTNLGSVLITLEDYPRACEVLAERVDRSRRILGPNHADTLDAMSSLATALVGAGDRSSGRSLSEQALAATTDTFGPDAPETLSALTQHARLLLRLGDAKVAATTYRAVGAGSSRLASCSANTSAGRACVVPCRRSPAVCEHHTRARAWASARSTNASPANSEPRT